MKATWCIPIDNIASRFLAAIERWLGSEITLCFEHAQTHPDAISLFKRYQSSKRYLEERDTVNPPTDLFYCRLNCQFAAELAILSNDNDPDDLFWHVKGYRGDVMIFWVHDAYGPTIAWLSNRIPEGIINLIAKECDSAAEDANIAIDWGKIRTYAANNWT